MAAGDAGATGVGGGVFSPWIVDFLFYAVGVSSIIMYANAAFERKDDRQAAINVSSRYLARRGPYNLGRVSFIALALGLYFLAVEVDQFRDLLIFLTGAAPPGGEPDPAQAGTRTAEWLELLTIPVVINVMLNRDLDWNPFTVARRIFRAWAAIPGKVIELAHRLERMTPPEERIALLFDRNGAADPGFTAVEAEDFARPGSDPRRRWAQVCFLYHELTRQDQSGDATEFFGDPEVQWAKMKDDLRAFLARHSDLAQVGGAAAFAQNDGFQLALRALHRRLCYLLAFFLVWNNAREDELWADLNDLGVSTDIPFSPSPATPLLAAAISLALAVLFGVTAPGFALEGVSDRLWPFFTFPVDIFDAHQVVRWGGYALISFLLPGAAMLIYRYVNFVMNGHGVYYSLWLGLFAAVFSFIASILGMAFLAWTFEWNWFGAGTYGDFVERAMLWGFAPAFLCWLLIWLLLRTPRVYRETRSPTHGVTFYEPVSRLWHPKNADPVGVGGDVEEAGGIMKRAAQRGAVAGLCMGVLNFVPAHDLHQVDLFEGSGESLEQTLMLYAVHESGDANLFYYALYGDAGAVDRATADQALARYINIRPGKTSAFSRDFVTVLREAERRINGESDAPLPTDTRETVVLSLDRQTYIPTLRRILNLSFSEFRTAAVCIRFIDTHRDLLMRQLQGAAALGSGEKQRGFTVDQVVGACNDFFIIRTWVARIQAVVASFSVGFLLVLVCAYFNIGLMPQPVRLRGRPPGAA